MTPRRRGRPPLDPSSKSVVVPLRMSERAYAETTARAKGERLTFAEFVRRAVKAPTLRPKEF